jgi:hypothetical protein
MTGDRWFIVLSPDGAARTVSDRVASTFKERFGDRCKNFTTRGYHDGFARLLKRTDDDMTVDLLNQTLIVSCLDFHATHMLVCALAPVTVFSLNLLRSYGVTTIHWFYEDFRRALYWRDCLPGYDHFCAIQRGPIKEACAAGGTNYHFLPTAGTVPGGSQQSTDRPVDVAFIGIPSPYRIAVLESLMQAGFSLAVAGEGWRSYRGALDKFIVADKWVDEKESAAILSNAKIGLNLSVEEPREREHVHISPRVYDVLACGCVLVTEEVPLAKESLDGCDFRTFTSSEDAGKVVADIRANYKSYAGSIESNRKAVAERHTFKKRVEKLVEITSKSMNANH